MIRCATLDEIKDRTDDYDEVWIVSAADIPQDKHKVTAFVAAHPNTRHVPHLAPTSKLTWAKVCWKSSGVWSDEFFRKTYTKQYLNDVLFSKPGRRKLERLRRLHSEGKRVALVTLGEKSRQCHSRIIAQAVVGPQNSNISY